MGDRVRRVDEEIIHVDDKPSFCDHVMEEIVHEGLEGGRGISETKEHHSWFKESFMSDKSGFLLMSILDLDIVISPLDIKFGEDFCSLEFIDEVGNEWKGVCITDSVFINTAVVLARAEATIFLLDKEEGEHLWGVGRTDLISS